MWILKLFQRFLNILDQTHTSIIGILRQTVSVAQSDLPNSPRHSFLLSARQPYRQKAQRKTIPEKKLPDGPDRPILGRALQTPQRTTSACHDPHRFGHLWPRS